MPSNREVLSKLQYLSILFWVCRLLDTEFDSSHYKRKKGIDFKYSERSYRALKMLFKKIS